MECNIKLGSNNVKCCEYINTDTWNVKNGDLYKNGKLYAEIIEANKHICSDEIHIKAKVITKNKHLKNRIIYVTFFNNEMVRQ